MSKEEASVVLGKFLANYGEEALRDLVEKVKSGEYDDTKERFANGEAGEVTGRVMVLGSTTKYLRPLKEKKMCYLQMESCTPCKYSRQTY